MKKNVSNYILIAIFFVGLSLVLYPSISNYWNKRTQSLAIVDYEQKVLNIDEKEYERYFQEAETYNQKLFELEYPLSESKKINGYDDILNVIGNGMMGYIEIEKLKVKLPIYHGTSDSVLDVATGHVKGSSFPIGGKSTHSVLSSHRGLPSAKLFTNLDKLENGDMFKITVLNRVCTYEVDQIRIVEPDDVSDLEIKEDMDYCTLVTCTPYGVNTHRLLVRGHRIENTKDLHSLVVSDAIVQEPIIVAIVIAIPVIAILIIIMLIKYRKNK